MLHTSRRHRATTALAAALTAGVLMATTGCTNSSNSHPAAGMPGMPGMTGMGGGMPGMGEVSAAPTTPAFAAAAPNGTGLSPSLRGYTLITSTSSIAAATPDAYTFHITGPSGKTVTRYQPYESAFVLCYVIRSDLSEFHELQPAMREDGTWTLALPSLPAGSYRMFVSFAAPDSSEGTPLVYQLSNSFTVRGTSTRTAPAADGYNVSVSGVSASGTSGPLTVAVTHGGEPVVSFDRFLDAYVHLTAYHAGDLASAHILSLGATPKGNGTTTAEALFPEPGTWRVFAKFEVNGTVHTTAVTLNVPAPSAPDTP